MAQSAVLDDLRSKYPNLSQYSDYELAQAVHKMYQDDTGDTSIDFNTFADHIGLSLTQIKDYPIPGQQETVAPVDAENAQMYDHVPPLTPEQEQQAQGAVEYGAGLPGTMQRHAPDFPARMEPLNDEPPPETIRGKYSTFYIPGGGIKRNIVDPLLGSRGEVTPETQAKAVMQFEADQQGLSPQQLREQVGPPIGPGARAAKDFAGGAAASAGSFLDYVGRFTGQDSAPEDLGKRLNEFSREMQPGDPNLLDAVASAFGSTAAFYVPGIGIAKGAEAIYNITPKLALWIGSGAAAALEASAEAGQVYDQSLADGKSPDEAASAADKTFWANQGLVAYTNKIGLFGEKGGQLMRRTLSAITEGGQEGAQQVIQNVATDRPAGEGVVESTGIGAVVGGGLGGTMDTPHERVGKAWNKDIQGADFGNLAEQQAVKSTLPEKRTYTSEAPAENQTRPEAPAQATHAVEKPEASVQQPQQDSTDEKALTAAIVEYRGKKRADSEMPAFRAGWMDAQQQKEDNGKSAGAEKLGGGLSAYDDGYTAYQEHAGRLQQPQHIEAGQAEPATDETIADSIETGAENTQSADIKAIRKDALAQIDAAIAKAPAREVADKQDQAYYDDIGYVTFDIPGDGKFKVLNTRDRLQAFRKKVASNQGFKKPPTIPKKSQPAKGTTAAEMLTDGEEQNAYEMAKLAGNKYFFGRNDKKKPILYVNTADVNVGGVDAVVGYNGSKKNGWHVLDKGAALSIGKGNSKAAAIKNALEMVNMRGVEAVEKARKQHGAMDQADLEKTYSEGQPQKPAAVTDGKPAEMGKQPSPKTKAAPKKKAAPRVEKSEPPKEKMGGPGATYTWDATVSDEAQPTSKKPIRREDILTPFLKALNVPLYQGRVKGRGMERTMGYFGPKRRFVRLRKHNDLATAAHELAHFIDDVTWRVDGRGGPKSSQPWQKGKHPKAELFAKELSQISYDASKVYEGFAEFVRHWMTAPQYAHDVAPEFSDYWENEFLPNSPYQKAIVKAQKGMTAWFNQSAVNRLLSLQGGKDSTKLYHAVMDTHFDELRQSFIDDMHGVLKYETAITGERTAVALGAYETVRLAKAASSIVDGVLRYGPAVIRSNGYWDFIDRNGNYSTIRGRDGKIRNNPAFKSWGLRDVLKPVSSELREWKAYATALSASELMEQGRENLISPEMIKAGLDLGNGRPHFRKAFDDWLEWNNRILDFAEQTEILSPDERKRFRRSLYLPFYRVGQNRIGKRMKGVEGAIKPFKQLTGGTQNLNDVVENMIQNAHRLLSEGIKNQARLKLVELSNRTDGGKFMEKQGKDTVPVHVTTQQVTDALLEGLGIDPTQYRMAKKLGQSDPKIDAIIEEMQDNLGDNVKFWLFGQSPKGDNMIAVKRDGQLEYYQVGDDLLYRAVTAINSSYGPKNWFTRGLNAIRRLGQGTVTLTLDFATANMWRDAIHSFVFSQNGFRPGIDSAIGMWSRISRNANYRAFIANGGGMASYMLDPKAFEDHINRFYRKQGLNWKMFLHTPQRLLLGLELLADAAEMSTRLGEFRRATMKGAAPRHAAYLAREISTDFAMRGDSQVMNHLYNTVMFLKAGVNSLDRVYRGFTRDVNRGHIALKSGALALASAWLYLYNRGNPCYEALEDWQKDNYWHVFIPTGKSGDCEQKHIHMRFPKIWEVGAIASSAERAIGAYLDWVEDKYDGKTAQHLGKIIADQFHLGLTWQAADPLIDVYALNENFFTKRPIIPDNQKDLAPFAQSDPRGSRLLRDLAKKTAGLPPELQFSPRRAEALIRGYFNTWGMYGLMLADEALYGDQLPKWRLEDYPVASRFMVKHPLHNTRYAKEFWELAHDAAMVHKTGQAMIKQRDEELAGMYLKKPENFVYKISNKLRDQIQTINGQMINIMESTVLSPDEKTRKIDELQVQKNEIYKQAFDNINASVHKVKNKENE